MPLNGHPEDAKSACETPIATDKLSFGLSAAFAKVEFAMAVGAKRDGIGNRVLASR